LRLPKPEDAAALVMQDAVRRELVDPLPGLKRGVQLDNRVWPQQARLKLVLHQRADAWVADRDEAARVVGVVADQALPQIKDLYVCLTFRSVRSIARSTATGESSRC